LPNEIRDGGALQYDDIGARFQVHRIAPEYRFFDGAFAKL
jgi:hypothetical protein